MTFTFTGVGSGGLNSTNFTDVEYEVLISADTDDISYPQRLDIPAIVGLSGTINLSGLGMGSFVQPLNVFNNQTANVVGFGDWSIPLDLISLFVDGVGLDTYDLTTSFGAINDGDPIFEQFIGVVLDIGGLRFTDMSYATFESNVVPEPTTLLLFGFGGLALLRKRRS